MVDISKKLLAGSRISCGQVFEVMSLGIPLAGLDSPQRFRNNPALVVRYSAKIWYSFFDIFKFSDSLFLSAGEKNPTLFYINVNTSITQEQIYRPVQNPAEEYQCPEFPTTLHPRNKWLVSGANHSPPVSSIAHSSFNVI